MVSRNYYAKNYFENGVDLFVNKHQKSPVSNAPPHHHDFAELAYTYSGKARHIIDGVSYPAGRGTLMFINYNSGHAIEVDETVIQIDILLSPRFISNELAGTDNLRASRVHRGEYPLHKALGERNALRRVASRPDRA